ncbi:unnamed protein product [Cuscuta epithymum]|uniref:Uncharacterized protein n=1 Tax=Cuscuta epithymum TaxID=186058 RepID=A0AAV0EQI9_9ASTE|nr:unnamed protein product [Cuscuta epithymum]
MNDVLIYSRFCFKKNVILNYFYRFSVFLFKNEWGLKCSIGFLCFKKNEILIGFIGSLFFLFKNRVLMCSIEICCCVAAIEAMESMLMIRAQQTGSPCPSQLFVEFLVWWVTLKTGSCSNLVNVLDYIREYGVVSNADYNRWGIGSHWVCHKKTIFV